MNCSKRSKRFKTFLLPLIVYFNVSIGKQLRYLRQESHIFLRWKRRGFRQYQRRPQHRQSMSVLIFRLVCRTGQSRCLLLGHRLRLPHILSFYHLCSTVSLRRALSYRTTMLQPIRTLPRTLKCKFTGWVHNHDNINWLPGGIQDYVKECAKVKGTFYMPKK